MGAEIWEEDEEGEVTGAHCGEKVEEDGVATAMANGAGHPRRPAPPRTVRLVGVAQYGSRVNKRGGSKRVDPSRRHGTNSIRPVTNHGTNRVGENFPRPLLFLFFYFKVLYYYICETEKFVSDPYFYFLFFLNPQQLKKLPIWVNLKILKIKK